MKLISKTTGAPLRVGDVVATYRGERVTLAGYSAPTDPGLTGRVYVQAPGGTVIEISPVVIDAVFVPGRNTDNAGRSVMRYKCPRCGDMENLEVELPSW